MEINAVISNIVNRRSIRKFEPKKIPKSLIDDIIEAGKYAPSSHNSQPWRFVVITSKVEIQKLSLYIKKRFKRLFWLLRLASFFSYQQKEFLESVKKRIEHERDLFFYEAPALIFICSKKSIWAKKDCSCASQNMMLAARSFDIGSCWIGFADVALNTTEIKKKLGIPNNLKIFASIVLGYPARFPEQVPRKKEADVINWIE